MVVQAEKGRNWWRIRRIAPRNRLVIITLAILLTGTALPMLPNIGRPFLAPATHGTGTEMRAPDYGKLPMSFEPNEGQTTDPSVRFQAHTPGGTLFFTPGGVVLSLAAQQQATSHAKPAVEPVVQRPDPFRALRQPFDMASTESRVGARPIGSHNEADQPLSPPQVVRMSFMGANPSVVITGSERLPGIVNYFIGNDPSEWHTNLPTYGAITYQGLYPGVDLEYGGTDRLLKGTYTIAPSANPGLIRWRYEGISKVSVDADGNLQIPLSGDKAGTLTEQAPVAWQEIDGRKVAVEARYELAPDSSIGVALGDYDHSQPLTLDPAITYSTYLGGADYDYGYDIAVDGAGHAYITGDTYSMDFPTTNSYQPACRGCPSFLDAFITKFNADGSTLVYSTYFGGSFTDSASGVSMDRAGNAYLTGYTNSTNFPTTPGAYQPTCRSCPAFGDAFVTKLNSTGSALVYSTYLGGSDDDGAVRIAVDDANNAYVSGRTLSTDFPTINAYQPTCRSCPSYEDVFVTKFNSTGSALAYSTYAGGSDVDRQSGLAVDHLGSAYVSGITWSTDFPTANAFQPSFAGYYDAFLTKFSPTGSALVYSTYLGGSAGDSNNDIAVDGVGSAYLTGSTSSTDFPTVNPFQPTLAGSRDSYVAKFNPAGSALVYSTYLGGSNREIGTAIAVDTGGNAYIAGDTSSTNFPTFDPFQPSLAGGYFDVYVAEFNPAGSALVFSSYLGGTDFDFSFTNIAVDGAGNAYIGGVTYSTNFPVRNPFQSLNHGLSDTFVAKIDGLAANQPTPAPASISNGENPKVDGVIVAWDYTPAGSGSGDIIAKDLATGRVFTVTQDLLDQRRPAVGGGQIIWQQRSQGGDWDIYGARILTNSVSNPVPIYQAPGDQVNAAASHNLVVWQSSTQALGTATPDDAALWDIAGENLDTGRPFTLTNGTATGTTNRNPSIDVYSDENGNYTNVAVWQSATLRTEEPTGGSTRWGLEGIINLNVPFTVPTVTGGDQTNPSTSNGRIVWQEVYTTFAGLKDMSKGKGQGVLGGSTRWGLWGIRKPLPGVPTPTPGAFTIADGLHGPPQPRISGNQIVYQNNVIEPTATVIKGARANEQMLLSQGRWAIVQAMLNDDDTVANTYTVTEDLASAPVPAISGERIVWQQEPPTPGTNGPPVGIGIGDSDVWGNIGTPTLTPCAGSSCLTSTLTPTDTATVAPTSTLVPCPINFSDVHASDYFYTAVQYLYCRGAVSGYSDGAFLPYRDATRGQLCKIAVLAEGWSIYTPSAPTFTDVPASNPFYAFVETAYRHGIVSGYQEGSLLPGQARLFRPDDEATRGQLCKIIVLAEEWPVHIPSAPTFRDVPSDQAFYQFIETAYDRGVISGYGCGQGCLEFRPGDSASRGQICKVVYQAITQP